MRIHLVTGGSASGKSAYAEGLLLQSGQPPFLYVAAMEPRTQETQKKIARHRRMRAGKGFMTLEKYRNLSSLKVPDNGGILLECISNLLANELFQEDGTILREKAKSAVLKGVGHLAARTDNLVIVTNEVQGDAGSYDKETENYRALLGGINQELARMADEVTEVVYGIPVKIKG